MKCDRAQKAILLNSTGELSGVGCEELEKHLAGCAGCRDFAASSAGVLALAGNALSEGEPSPRAMAVIASAARFAPRSHNIFVFTAWTRVLALAATLMAVVGTAVYLSGRDPADHSIAEVSVMAAAMNVDALQSAPDVPAGDRGTAMNELGRQLLEAEGLFDDDDDMLSEVILYEPDSTDPRASNTSLSLQAERA